MADFTKTLITDVFTIYGYSPDDKLIFTSKNLTTGGVDTKNSSVEIRNGVDETLFGLLGTKKDVTITLTENTFNFDTLAAMAGTTIVTGAGVGYSSEVNLVVATGLTITLPVVPKAGNTAILNMKNNGVDITGSLVGSTVTLTGAIVGDIIKVYPYEIVTSATTQTITINSNDFPTGIKLVLMTKEVSPKRVVISDVQIVCPNAIATGDWKLDTSSAIKSTDVPMVFKILQIEDTTKLYTISKIPRVIV